MPLRIIIFTVVCSLFGTGWVQAQHFGYHESAWLVDHHEWNFNNDPARLRKWRDTLYKIEPRYYSVYAGIPFADSSGKLLIFIVDGYIYNSEFEELGYLTKGSFKDVRGDKMFKGIKPRTVNLIGGKWSHLLGYRLDTRGVVDSLWVDSKYPIHFPIPQYTHWFADQDTVWAVSHMGLQKTPDDTTQYIDSITIGYLTNKGETGMHAVLPIPLPKEVKIPLTAAESLSFFENASRKGGLILSVLHRSPGSQDEQTTKRFHLHIELNSSLNQVKKVTVMDSFEYGNYRTGVNPGRPFFSPNGKMAYTFAEHTEKVWPDRRGEIHTNAHYRLWQYDLENHRKRELRLKNSADTIIGINAWALAPDGQVYITAVFDSLRGDPDLQLRMGRRVNFFGKISFPNQWGDSCFFHLHERDSLDNVFYANQSFIDPRGLYRPLIDYEVETNCKSRGLKIKNNSEDFFTSFKWYFLKYEDSTVVDSAKGFEPQFDLPQSGKYFVRGMGQTATGFKSWRWNYFDYLKVPTAKFDTNLVTACQWAQVQLEDQTEVDTVNEQTGNSWQWEFFLDDKRTAERTVQNPKIKFEEPGLYSVKLNYSNGFCSDTLYQGNLFEIKPAPQPGFSISDTFACTPDTVKYENTSTDAYTKHEFQWADLSVEAATAGQRFVNSPGAYWLTQRLYGDNGCVSKDSALLKVVPGFTANYHPTIFSASVAAPDSVEIQLKAERHASALTLNRSTTPLTITDFKGSVYHDLITIQQNNFITYQMAAIDSCGRASGNSNTVRTIFLTAENIENSTVIFKWNHGIGVNGEINAYEVEQQLDDGMWSVVYSSKTNDGQLDFAANEGQVVSYRVKGYVTTDTLTIASLSNVVEVKAQTLLFVPNAFSPNGDGLNDVFKIGNFGVRDFEGRIFSRWGQVIGYSTNVDEIWDGLDVNAQYYPAGSYTYHFKITTETGENRVLTGSIYLIR